MLINCEILIECDVIIEWECKICYVCNIIKRVIMLHFKESKNNSNCFNLLGYTCYTFIMSYHTCEVNIRVPCFSLYFCYWFVSFIVVLQVKS